MSPTATQLKDEGNKLFSQRNFSGAILKYAEAIVADENNAVLYANRAACYLNTKEYLNAVSDAKQAITIDPKYAKAYARLATAHDMLSEYWQSVEDWQKALDALPTENPTDAEIKQREQYQAGLKTSQAALEKLMAQPDRHFALPARETSQLPWVAAEALLPRLAVEGNYNSSAWIICTAAKEFIDGVNKMKTTTKVGAALVGHLGVIASISNAVLADNRAFHISDPRFVSMYNLQVQHEATNHGAWTDAGPAQIKKEVHARLQTGGWNSVRPAISVSIRCLIMRAFLEGSLRGLHNLELEFLTTVLEILEWGREVFRDVPREERGTVFDLTFVRGVRNMHLHALMETYATNPSGNEQYLEELLKRANDLIREVDENPPPESLRTTNPGFKLAYYDYCKGHALAMKGFYYNKVGNSLASKDRSKGIQAYSAAGHAYLAAAECFPPDDECYSWFLHCAIQAMWGCGTPVCVQLEAMEKLRKSLPEMKKIWSCSQMSKGGTIELCESMIKTETSLRDMVAKGEVSLDDCVSPQEL
ncbi:uncharacterized protein EV420DRAFT_1494816 [Desarmillaria tabescens]|uniref:TPR-like protein n=1 Tax=Armillaria tabescens TaxID=1929756 RepID=A0AA39T7B5_ARMTA|nr:uncharacterized protein EV420DRAFT_1494816 [Desarmillaria tabescens]KAK0469496.1 hypothetical protein EV420DRAFT_1494816 [Desarmillaria tabescens]